MPAPQIPAVELMALEERHLVAKLAEEQRHLLIGAVDQCLQRLIDQVSTASAPENSVVPEQMKPSAQPENMHVKISTDQQDEISCPLPQPVLPVSLWPEDSNGKASGQHRLQSLPSQDDLEVDDAKGWFHRTFGGIYPTKENQAFLDVVIGAVIVLNSLAMMVDLQYNGLLHAQKLGLKDEPWSDTAGEVLEFIKKLFAVIFILELVLRLSVLRLEYFYSWFNLFDALLVLSSLITLAGLQIADMNYIRLVRLARVLRSLRLLRTMRLFAGLRTMVHCIQKLVPFLMWALLFLGVYVVMAALVVGNLLDGFIQDEDQDLEMRRWVWLHYGTSGWATYTMFEITFSGGWPGKVRPILTHVSPWYIVIFLPFVTFINFAALKVITGIIMKETFSKASGDASFLAAERLRAQKKQMKQLKKSICSHGLHGRWHYFRR